MALECSGSTHPGMLLGCFIRWSAHRLEHLSVTVYSETGTLLWGSVVLDAHSSWDSVEVLTGV